jgi:hypothetical protein
VSWVIVSLSLACVAERLAGVAGGEDVDGFDLRPVGLLHVAVVGDVGPVVGEDRGRVAVVLAEPGGARVEHGFDGEV